MIGFLSDAHGHVGAFEKALSVLRGHGASDIYFLGDAVGYLPSGDVVEILRRERIPCVRGNHDEKQTEWPVERVIERAGGSFHLVHGSPREPLNEYVYPDTPLEELVRHSKASSAVMGHTHLPFIRSYGGVTFVNTGSCGLPRDDARFGSVALFNPDESGFWRILRFNIEAESHRMMDTESISDPMREFFRSRRSEQILGDVVG